MSGCFGGSKEDDYFERQLYNHLSEKSYCEKHEIYYDECRTFNGGCPDCEEEDPEIQMYKARKEIAKTFAIPKHFSEIDT